MRDFIKNHQIALVVGLCVAMLAILPHARMIVPLYNSFEGIYPSFNNDEAMYHARIKEVVEGNFSIGNPYFKEHESAPFVMPPLAEWIVAIPASVFGISVPLASLAVAFVFIFLNYSAIYLLFLHITNQRKEVSSISALLVCLLFLASLSRPISPSINALFLFGGLAVLLASLSTESEAKRGQSIVAGFVVGLSSFFYPYYFSTLVVFYFVTHIVSSIFRRNLTMSIRTLPWFLISFVPISGLYVLLQVSAGNNPFYAETVQRFGLVHSHMIGSFVNISLGIMSACILFLAYRTLSTSSKIIGMGASLTIIILNAQNVITGTSLQFGTHYRLSTIVLLGMVIAVTYVSVIANRQMLPPIHRWSITLALLLCVCISLYAQKREFYQYIDMPYTREEVGEMQELGRVFEWFSENTERDSVVYVLGGAFNDLLPVYTENKVFYNPYAAFYTIANVQLEDRWLIQNIFEDDITAEKLIERHREFWGNTYIDEYQSAEVRKKISSLLLRTPYTPHEMLREVQVAPLLKLWNDMRSAPLEKAFTRYTADYILLSPEYGRYEQVKNILDNFRGVRLVTDIEGIRIYSFDGKN